MAYAPTIDDVELDRQICREATGGPTAQVTIIVSGNAKEQRNIDWPQLRNEWQIMWVANATDNKFKNLVSFFNARLGQGHGFRFFDWSDNSDWGNGKVLYDDTIGKYRLYKEYPDTARPYRRKIYLPINGTIVLNGVAGATAANINYLDGTINGATSGGTWTGNFNIPARFDAAKMVYKITPELNVVWNGLQVIELV